jgi:hypothetical protein
MSNMLLYQKLRSDIRAAGASSFILIWPFAMFLPSIRDVELGLIIHMCILDANVIGAYETLHHVTKCSGCRQLKTSLYKSLVIRTVPKQHRIHLVQSSLLTTQHKSVGTRAGYCMAFA